MGKWLVRGGSILAMAGFFLPGVLISCSVPGTGGFLNSVTSYSLADIANESFVKQGILFLVPLLLLLSLIFSFFPLSGGASQPRWNVSVLGQAGGFLASLGTLAFSLSNLSRQASQAGRLPFSVDLSQMLEIKPEAGLYVFVAGYLLLLVGILMQVAAPGRKKAPPGQAYLAPAPPPAVTYIPPNAAAPPGIAASSALFSLEMILPGVPPGFMRLQNNQYLIGRGEGSEILLTDLSVSRQHALLYFYQGAWHIEDRGSTAGTLVNGRPVQAARLNPGDQVQLGRVTLVLRRQ